MKLNEKQRKHVTELILEQERIKNNLIHYLNGIKDSLELDDEYKFDVLKMEFVAPKKEDTKEKA